MSVDKRILEALETGKVYSVDDNDYVSVANVSRTGITLNPGPNNPYGSTPIYCPLNFYGSTWALTKEEIKK